MPRHQDKDASFDVPEGWRDRTIVAFAAPEKKGVAASNFVMTREAIREGDSLRAHVDRQLLELGRHLKDFDLMESKEITLGGLPAVFMRYTWMGHFGRLEQSLSVVERNLEQGRVATSFTATAPAQEAPSIRPIFEAMLKTVRFASGPRLPGGSIPPSSGPSSIGGGHGSGETPVIPMPGIRGERR